MSKEAMKLALEALTKNSDRVTEIRMKADAIKALEEALAKQEQGEPVAWEVFALKFANGTILQYGKPENLPKYLGCRPLYTTPQQPSTIVRTWVGLTDEEVETIFQLRKGIYPTIHEVEAKLKEKNT
jgi:hypothetical protein